MFLDLQVHNYEKDIIPFIKNGIIIDTSIIKIIIDGLVLTRISKKRAEELPDYAGLLGFLDLIKVNNRWNKFYITPHILTEVCNHLRNDYNDNLNYKQIVEEVIPLLGSMAEKLVEKSRIIGHIDFKNPVIEIGDISIFAIADDFLNETNKIAILSNDRELNRTFADKPNVMVMDYRSIMLNRA